MFNNYQDACRAFDAWSGELLSARKTSDVFNDLTSTSPPVVFICAQEVVQVFLERFPQFAGHRSTLVSRARRMAGSGIPSGFPMVEEKWLKEKELAGL